VALALTLATAPCAALAGRYRVEILPGRSDDDGALRRARVEARLSPREGEIGFFRSGADTGLFHQWATFLLDLEATDAAGEPLELIYEHPGTWRLPNWRKGEVTARYTMLLQHDRFPNEPGDDELAAARSYGVMWTTRALVRGTEPVPLAAALAPFGLVVEIRDPEAEPQVSIRRAETATAVQRAAYEAWVAAPENDAAR
jgi:hypothetical protein